jgi:ClpP class serine protease
MPLIMKMIKGEAVNWGLPSERTEAHAEGGPPEVPRRMKMMNGGEDVFIARPYHNTDRFPYNSIVMIDMIGPVLKYGDYCSYGSVEHTATINRFANAKNIAGIIINIDSPGGQAAGTASLANAIRQAAKLKPVIGIVQDGIAASAAMWVLSACQESYVTEDTDAVGSIGAYNTLYDFSGWFEKEGIKEISVYAPQSVDKNKDYRDAIKGDTSLIEEDLEFLVNDFVSDVKTFRGARLKAGKEDPFTGKMYNAAQAVKLGLIDGIKSLDQVVKRTRQLIDLRTQNKNAA